MLQQHLQGRVGAALHQGPIAGFQHGGVGAIFPELHPATGFAQGPHRKLGPGRHHHGPAREAHRADRINHDRFDARVQDRPTGSHGVASGAGGSGDDQAVAAVLIHHLTIDLQLQQTGGGHLIEAGPEIEVVESQVGNL